MVEPAVRDRLTADDLARMRNGDDFDLHDGQLVRRVTGNRTAWICSKLTFRLATHVRDHALGWMFGGGAGFVLDAPRRLTVLRPSGAFVRFGRLEKEQPSDDFDAVAPDLVIEGVSPFTRNEQLRSKIDKYLAAGVQLVWLLHPVEEWVAELRPARTARYFGKNDLLCAEDVIPGFAWRLADMIHNSTMRTRSAEYT